jgi:phenylacetate-CoA ligase
MGLAQYLQLTKQDISQCRPDLVISRAAPLYDHEKSLLAEVFGCPITNIYGTRELGHVAMICERGSFHVNQENYIVEIEKTAAGKETAGPGTVLVTPLYVTPMPFLRYRLDDIAEFGGSGCPCGRSLMLLKKILGRTGEMFQTRDGRTIEPNFWCIAFESGRQRLDIERFQVVYRSQDLICMRIVRRPSYSSETEADLRKFIDANFPSNIRFEFEYVPEIKPLASGKYRFVVNEIRQRDEDRVLV